MNTFKCNIKMTTVTPLRVIAVEQDEPRPGVTSLSRIVVKKHLVNGELVKIPVVSASKIRGTVRRLGTAKILEAGFDNEAITEVPLMDSVNLQSGGANNYSGLTKPTIANIRTLNPVLSLLGFSLAVSGKLAVTDFIPKINIDTENNSYELPQFHDVVERKYIVKFADVEKYLTDEQLETMKEDTVKILDAKNVAAREKYEAAEAQKAIDGKAHKVPKPKESLKTTFQSLLASEFIRPGADFYGQIFNKQSEPLSDVEKGLMLLILEDLVKKPIGADMASAAGVLKYHMTFGDGSSLRTEVDAMDITNIDVITDYSDDLENCKLVAQTFLDNIHKDNIIISDALDDTKNCNSMLKNRVTAMQERLAEVEMPETIDLLKSINQIRTKRVS